MKLSKTEIAYLAGLFDGEGCLLIARTSPGKPWSSRQFRFQSRVSLNIRERHICEAFKKAFGGSVRKNSRNNEKWATTYNWQGNSKTVIAMSEALLPFLRLKNRQAKLLLQFQKLKAKSLNKQLDDKTYKIYNEFYEKMRKLNKKGPRNED